ncbi:hypothetical protein [Streptomyces boluensis]|uniref:Uncharacterized protein n=1 Tax=Streptomyces boluensis TaxID=1775135 RepID=A0A964UZE0_9ACTN|nr:hypothetical protein [Streptomyces boluensis]
MPPNAESCPGAYGTTPQPSGRSGGPTRTDRYIRTTHHTPRAHHVPDGAGGQGKCLAA